MAANGDEGLELARKVELALIIFRKDEFKMEDNFLTEIGRLTNST